MERIFFANKKGQQLAGLFNSLSPLSNPTAVIVCHGFTGSKEGGGKAVAMAEYIGQNGMSTLLFDFAGCGESEGDPADLSLGGQVGDLESAVELCCQRGYTRILTMGRSFGGTTAICQAPSDNRVSGVCALAAPCSLMELFLGFTDEDLPDNENALVSLAGDEGLIQLKRSFFTDLAGYNVAHSASLIAPRPLLLVQGARDTVVPPKDAGIIYRSAGEPKNLQLLEGADHQFSAHYREVWDIFIAWVKNNF